MAWEIGSTSVSAATLMIIGLVLFLFPEPATSAFGLFLIGLGVLIWFMGW
jgi:hypothetical protein